MCSSSEMEKIFCLTEVYSCQLISNNPSALWCSLLHRTVRSYRRNAAEATEMPAEQIIARAYQHNSRLLFHVKQFQELSLALLGWVSSDDQPEPSVLASWCMKCVVGTAVWSESWLHDVWSVLLALQFGRSLGFMMYELCCWHYSSVGVLTSCCVSYVVGTAVRSESWLHVVWTMLLALQFGRSLDFMLCELCCWHSSSVGVLTSCCMSCVVGTAVWSESWHHVVWTMLLALQFGRSLDFMLCELCSWHYSSVGVLTSCCVNYVVGTAVRPESWRLHVVWAVLLAQQFGRSLDFMLYELCCWHSSLVGVLTSCCMSCVVGTAVRSESWLHVVWAVLLALQFGRNLDFMLCELCCWHSSLVGVLISCCMSCVVGTAVRS
jgi:hypothetical protein